MQGADGSNTFFSTMASSVLTGKPFSPSSSQYKTPFPCKSSGSWSSLSCAAWSASPWNLKTWLSSVWFILNDLDPDEVDGIGAWAPIESLTLTFRVSRVSSVLVPWSASRKWYSKAIPTRVMHVRWNATQ